MACGRIGVRNVAAAFWSVRRWAAEERGHLAGGFIPREPNRGRVARQQLVRRTIGRGTRPSRRGIHSPGPRRRGHSSEPRRVVHPPGPIRGHSSRGTKTPHSSPGTKTRDMFPATEPPNSFRGYQDTQFVLQVDHAEVPRGLDSSEHVNYRALRSKPFGRQAMGRAIHCPAKRALLDNVFHESNIGMTGTRSLRSSVPDDRPRNEAIRPRDLSLGSQMEGA
jgi:hypothetical protein